MRTLTFLTVLLISIFITTTTLHAQGEKTSTSNEVTKSESKEAPSDSKEKTPAETEEEADPTAVLGNSLLDMSSLVESLVKDRIQTLTTDLSSIKEEMSNISTSLMETEEEKSYEELKSEFSSFREEISKISATQEKSVEESYHELRTEIGSLQVARTDGLKMSLNKQAEKIIQTADFVRAANVSLNALKQSVDISSYLNDVAALNNPNNSDLGFSLSEEVIKIAEKGLFKDRKKVGGAGKSRFVQIMKGIISNPITKAVTGILPVVGSLNSVANTVTSMAAGDEDIPVEEIQAFRNDLKVYIEHYQGLADANTRFQIQTDQIIKRLDEVDIHLVHLTTERVKALYKGEVKMDDLAAMTVNTMLSEYYKSREVADKVDEIMETYEQEGEMNYDKALRDASLLYPEYVMAEAQLVYDELDALAHEYMLELYLYQEKIGNVLKVSVKNGIADEEKVLVKLDKMMEKLESVETSFNAAVDIDDVKNEFNRLRKIDLTFKK